MADNVTYQDTTLATPPSATVVATDDVGGVQYQRVKLDIGGDGVASPVTTANPMPISDAGGSITVDGPLTDAQLRASAVPVSAAALPLPSGAATAANQATEITSLASIDTKTPALGQALAAASVPIVLTAAQITTLTPPAAITGFATEATLATRLSESDFDTKTGSLTETAPATDTASSGINGRLQRIAQRLTSLIALIPASLGQKASAASLAVVVASDQSAVPVSAASLPLPSGASTAALQTQPGVDIGDVTVNNAAGASAVNIQDGGNSITVDGSVTATVSGTATTSDTATLVDDAAFTPATSRVMMTGAMFDDVAPDSVNEGDGGAVRMSSNRNLYATLRDAAGNERGANVSAGNALLVDASATTQPVSGTVAATQSGTWNVTNVSGTVSLPTGAATEATLGTRLTESDFDTKTGSLTEAAPASDTASSGLNGRLQRIAQRITSLIALIPAALVSGRFDVNIGAAPATLTVASHAVTNAGTFAVQAATAGDVAHDAADSGNPVKAGAKAIAHGTNPTAVAAADRTDLYANRAGIPFVIGGHPNIVTIEAAYTAAQTDTSIVSVAGGLKIVVTQLQFTADNANTVDVGFRVGFGAANTPTTTGVVLTHPGVAAGSGVSRGDGSGILGVGADGEDLRITSEVPTTGSVRVLVSYYTIES